MIFIGHQLLKHKTGNFTKPQQNFLQKLVPADTFIDYDKFQPSFHMDKGTQSVEPYGWILTFFGNIMFSFLTLWV